MITALYFYSPTTFQTNEKIEPMFGTPHPPGKIELQPGIYRLRGNAKVVAANGAQSSAFSVVPLDDTKGGWPDPPLQAMQQHNMTAAQINAFLTGTGHQTTLD